MVSTLVIIPTYNEAENLPAIVSRLFEANPEVNLLVVDDASPDGTGDLADELSAENDQIHVLHRKNKDGLLGAYLAGFEWGLERDYEVLVEMDADGSHAPEQLHRLLDEIENGADLVIGSRYVDGGEVVNWPADRHFLSRAGNLYIAAALGTGLTDMTAGYRAFRREVLETIDLDALSRAGYIFQVELAFRAVQAGFDVTEVPITFTERIAGESKLDGSFVKDSLAEVTKWGVDHRSQQAQDLFEEMSKLAAYEYRNSGLSNVGEKVKNAASGAKDFASEAVKLGSYEIKNSPLANLGPHVQKVSVHVKELGKEMANLASYEVGRVAKN